jgi:DNA-binding transcriptional MerR regulator
VEYSVNRLSKLSGVSARTLRYYDEIGLLKPARIAESGYRLYGQAEVDLLQQILLYRELGFPLEEIKTLLAAPDFDRAEAFTRHLTELHTKRQRLDALIHNVTQSIAAMKGEVAMTNTEKFEGFKQKLVDDNERQYGTEIREKYGDDAIDASNANLMGLTEGQYNEGERIRLEFEDVLQAAFAGGDPASQTAQKACDLHRQWLSVFAPNYSKAYHKSLGEMYVADERFRANYDKFGDGCTEFLRDAINVYRNH